MAPIVHGLEAEFSGQVNFAYLDIDDPANRPFKEQLEFRYQPHFFLLDADGNILQQWLGRVSEQELRQTIQAALQ
jgi:thioredoxin-like negative regulator of GroEL